MKKERARLRSVAKGRIDALFSFSRRIHPGDPELSERAIAIARRISMKSRVRIPRRHRIFFCHICGKPLFSLNDVSLRVRSRRSTHLVLRCKRCGHLHRIPATREKDRLRKKRQRKFL